MLFRFAANVRSSLIMCDIVLGEIFISRAMILSLWGGFERILSETALTTAGVLVSLGQLVFAYYQQRRSHCTAL